jgi:hypothetical protein
MTIANPEGAAPMLAVFGIGFLELLIVGGMCLVIPVTVAVVIVVVMSQNRNRDDR